MSCLFKYAGILSLVLCLSALGFIKTYSKREYIRKLKGIYGALSHMDDMLRLSGQTKERILTDCFGETAGFSRTPKGASISFAEDDETGIIINRFLSEFGNGDLSLEQTRIDRVKNELKTRLLEQEREYTQFGKIWRTAGVCAGLVVGIMLI